MQSRSSSRRLTTRRAAETPDLDGFGRVDLADFRHNSSVDIGSDRLFGRTSRNLKGPVEKLLRFRNYWIYSAGCAIAWAVVLVLAWTIRGPGSAQTLLLVFLGFLIGWGSGTIARYVYPPPKRWR